MINSIMTIKYNEIEFIDVCENSRSMAEAASKLGLYFNTFKRHALLLGVYSPNQAGRGVPKSKLEDGIVRYKLKDILNGKHPQYQTNKLRIRLIEAGIKFNKCDMCGITEWNDLPVTMQLDHIDGVGTNHVLSNLRMLCPNCHTQTPTWGSKNIKLDRTI